VDFTFIKIAEIIYGMLGVYEGHGAKKLYTQYFIDSDAMIRYVLSIYFTGPSAGLWNPAPRPVSCILGGTRTRL